jgi:diguanylate cyclase (GGDEF)-like protein/PAS domain S-box-containing protein
MAILAMPMLILTAFRFEFGVVAAISFLLGAITAVSTSHGLYPDLISNHLFALTFLAAIGVSNLVIAAGLAAIRNAFTQLTSSEQRFRAMFEQAGVGFLLLDLESGQRAVNQKLSDMFGYSVAELSLSHPPVVSFPEDQQITEELTQRMMTGEVTGGYQEKRYFRSDGSVIWASVTLSQLRAPDGKVNYVVGVFEDITARKRAKKQLEGQTHILHALTLGASMTDSLRDLALLAEEFWPKSCCAIFLADAANNYLYFGAAPSIPGADKHVPSFPIADRATRIALAVASKQAIVSNDMRDDALWQHLCSMHPEYAEQPTRWAVPFTTTTGELVGILLFYFDRVCTPTKQDEEAIAILSSLAGVVIQRHRDALRLRDSEQRFRITFQQAAVGMALLDNKSNWLQINQKFCDIVGYTRDELMQLRYGKLIAPDEIALATQAIANLRRSSAWQIQAERRYVRKNGDLIWVNSQLSVTRNDDGDIDYQIAVIEDITERKQAEAEVERLALYDYLTGLPNRRLFGDRMRTAIAAAKRSDQYGALIYIDLDNFKQLNDAHGHNAGDDFLKMVAQRLRHCLRDEDTVARLGGDEFVALLQNLSDSLPGTTLATTAIAEKIQIALSEPFLLPNGVEHIVTSSLGITLYPKDQENAEDLLKEADIAMYRVKEAQRNAMRFYEPAMKVEADSRLALERALRRALYEEEFELFLQPQYDAAHTMVGCEALLRWPQSDGTFIPPNEFIPIAEETGLIVPLGEWVLRRAGKLVQALELAGHTIVIAVNVSPRQFSETNFVERVRTILWETGADPGRIMLEITEGIVVADFDDVRAKMLVLRRLGIRLSIDDFGTGHSSLAYLKLLPLHELKIDRAFISYLPDDNNDAAIVEAILSVAHHLQLEVVAEGVETAAQLEFLKQRGCQRFQGFYLARPAAPLTHFPDIKIL